LISGSPISIGWRLLWKKMKRRIQTFGRRHSLRERRPRELKPEPRVRPIDQCALNMGADGNADAVEELRGPVLARDGAREGGDGGGGRLGHFAFF
jgi:hypothetical protein